MAEIFFTLYPGHFNSLYPKKQIKILGEIVRFNFLQTSFLNQIMH